MRAIRIRATNGPESFTSEDVPEPHVGPDDVLVRVARAAFNRRDIFVSQGRYPGIALPVTPGSDGVGTIAAFGANVRGLAEGARVVIDPEFGWNDDPLANKRHGEILGMPRDGTFAQYVAVPASTIYPAPADLSDDEAAALPLAGLTAYRAAFTRGRLSANDTVLITGVGSGVQTFVLLYAILAGARTIVTSGSDEKLARATALGANVAINYKTTPAWHAAVRDATEGIGPSLVVDGSGGETLARALDIARVGGRVVIYGATLGDTTFRPFSIFWKHLDLLGTSMGSPTDFAAMLALFGRGLRPVVDRTFVMDEAPAAARRVLDGEQFGKVVLAIP